LVLWIPHILAVVRTLGLGRAVGYPTGEYQDLPAWAQRANRAHLNLVENLIPFAALVLVAQVSGAANEVTAMAARLFFWMRLMHAVVQIAGVPWLRTIAFAVSWACCLVILLQILI
jgi:uncharacterized MAPEG superfamily protein